MLKIYAAETRPIPANFHDVMFVTSSLAILKREVVVHVAIACNSSFTFLSKN